MKWKDSKSPALKGNGKPSCPDTCWCGCLYCYDTFFKDTTVKNSPVYHLGTVWGVHHPEQIYSGLASAGFAPTANVDDGSPICGYKRALKVYREGVYRGWLDVNVVDNKTIRPFDQDAVQRINGVLRQQYPFVEILIIFAVTVIPIMTILAGILYCGTRQKRKKEGRPGFSAKLNPMFEKSKLAAAGASGVASRQKQNAQYLYKVVSRKKDWHSPPLLTMPNELQLDILQYLDYHDIRRLRRTCRFYRVLVSDEYFAERKTLQKFTLQAQDTSNKTLTQPELLPCWSCELIKDQTAFRLRHLLPDKGEERQCFGCEMKGKSVVPGTWYEMGGPKSVPCVGVTPHQNEILLCFRCGKETGERSATTKLPDALYECICGECRRVCYASRKWRAWMRGLQYIFYLITFSVACASNFAFHHWAFGLTVGMTTFWAMARLLLLPFEFEGSKGARRMKVFAFIEAVLWLGVTVYVTYEGARSQHKAHKFDQRAIATTFFIWMEFILAATCLVLATDTYLDWRKKRIEKAAAKPRKGKSRNSFTT